MIIDKTGFTVDGVDFTQYLLQVDFGYNKLWASDSGRNLAGKQTGTLIGIFPKFELQFRKLTASELHIVAPILDKPRQTVRYCDDNSGTYKTIQTYSGDYKISNKYINVNEPFNCNLIAVEKRS